MDTKKILKLLGVQLISVLIFFMLTNSLIAALVLSVAVMGIAVITFW